MKKGFTMIELIFVIILIGILGAVAIPKLAATRDDAEVAKALSDLRTATSDFIAYYTAKGQFGKISDMTNVSASRWSADVNLTDNPTFITHNEACLQFQIGADGNFTISPVTASPSNTICKSLINSKAFQAFTTSFKFGGSSVNP